MLRFAEMLQTGWRQRRVPAFLVQPEPWLGKKAPGRLHKWAAYVDQYVRFPGRAAKLAKKAGWNSAQPTVFHICDHSNSIYLRGLGGRRVVLTCHDLLAVRGALGEPTYCPASRTGKYLQAMILSNLRRTPWVACDSAATAADLRRLTGRGNDPHIETIPLALNAPFVPVPTLVAGNRLAKYPGLLDAPYILHVGSGLVRKNREGVLRSLALAREYWKGRVVFAGEPLQEREKAVARELKLPDDVVREIPHPEHDELVALYNRAHALVFPSYCEGYGWPVLEAQACGCPVICSNVTSLPEVAGDAGILLAPDDHGGYADAILSLSNYGERSQRIAAGIANAARFSEARMFDAYAKLYQRALA